MSDRTPQEDDALKAAEQSRADEYCQALLRMGKYVDFSHAERLLSMQAVKEFGTISVRMLSVLNGGAIIALLTLIGSLFAKAEAQQNLIAISLTHSLTKAFLCFGIGLVLSAVAAGLGYINFSYVVKSYSTPAALHSWLLAKPVVHESHSKAINGTQYAAIGCIALGLCAFVVGAWFVYKAFTVLGL